MCLFFFLLYFILFYFYKAIYRCTVQGFLFFFFNIFVNSISSTFAFCLFFFWNIALYRKLIPTVYFPQSIFFSLFYLLFYALSIRNADKRRKKNVIPIFSYKLSRRGRGDIRDGIDFFV